MDLVKELLSAIKIIAKKEISNTDKNTTIECRVVSVIDEAKRLYEVEYLGNSMQATSIDSESSFSCNDLVYVTVPNGKFNNKKLILGAVSPNISTFVNTDQTQSFNIKSENILKDLEEYNICSFNDRLNKETNQIGYSVIEDEFGIINKYMKEYSYIRIGFNVKTKLPNEQNNGNYGVRINIPFFDENGKQVLREYYLDKTNIQGDPFSKTEEEEVFVSYEIDNKNYDSSRNITLEVFCEDFIQNENIIEPDIFIKQINFQFAERLSEEELSSYSLNIVPTEGKFFAKNLSTSKKLVPELKIKGKKTNLSNSENMVYWFRENNQIQPVSPLFSKYGGYGWECLNERATIKVEEDGQEVFNFNSLECLEVFKKDIPTEIRYKCVVVSNSNDGEKVISSIISIENLLSNISIDIISETGNVFLKDIGEVHLTGVVNNYDFPLNSMSYFYWNRYDKNGNFIEQFNTTRRELSFMVNTIDEINTIGLTVAQINSDGTERIIGSKSLLLFNTEKAEFSIQIQGSQQVFKYNSDGLSPLFLDKDFMIKPLNFRIFTGVGTEISESDYKGLSISWKIPRNNSMLKMCNENESDDNYFISHERELYFSIENYYNLNNDNNDILLEVKYGDKIFSRKVSIGFIKDGENGTNGTRIYGVIKSPSGNQSIYGFDNKTKSWYDISSDNKYLMSYEHYQVNVFENGEELVSPNYSVTWEMLDRNETNTCFQITSDGRLYASKNYWGSSDIYCNIIKATIKIESGQYCNLEINAFYPIDIVYFEDISKYNYFLPKLTGGFNNVLYASDGTNPTYKDKPFIIESGISRNNEIQSTTFTSNNLSIFDKNVNTFKAKPVPKFDNGESKNYINLRIYSPYGQNYSEQLSLINELQKRKNLVILENQKVISVLNSFDYNNLSNKLNTCGDYLKDRGDIINYCNILNKRISDLLEYKAGTMYKEAEISNIDSLQQEVSILKKNLYLLCKNTSVSNIVELTVFDLTLNSQESSYARNNIETRINEITLYVETVNNRIREFLSKETTAYQHSVFCDVYKELLKVVKNENLSFSTTVLNLLKLYLGDITNDRNKEYFSQFDIQNNILRNFSKVLSFYGDNTGANEDYKKEVNDKISCIDLKINELNIQVEMEKELSSIYNLKVVYIRPIVMLYNTYEMSNLNAWDGNKIYTDTSGEYISAPQLGAGKKESNNTFTGLIMGLKSHNRSTSTKAGLYAYQSGVQTIALEAEDGSAKFGRSGSGQIIINPYGTSSIAGWEINEKSLSKQSGSNKVTLNSDAKAETRAFEATDGSHYTYIQYNGTFYSNSGTVGGWHINSDKLWAGGTQQNPSVVLDKEGNARFGEWFSISSEGKIVAKQGTIGGWNINSNKLWAGGTAADPTVAFKVEGDKGSAKFGDGFFVDSDGSITSTKGTIAGWHINSNKLWAGGTASNPTVMLKVDGEKGSAKFGSNFSVDSEGSIVSKKGTIGGWTISSDKLANSSGTVVLNKDGSAKFGTGFSVDNTGKIKSISGTIGGWVIGEKRLRNEAGTVILNMDGSAQFGSGFKISSAGKITAVSGTIAGWTIGESTLKGGNVTLNKSGALKGTSWSISADGVAKFDNLQASAGGKIGGWTIGSSTLKGGSVTFNSNGHLSGTNWDLSSGGVATFSDIRIKGGSMTGGKVAISGSGTTIDSGGAKLGESTTKVGSKVIGTYVKDLCVDTLKAQKIKTSQLEADTVNGKSVSWTTVDVVTSIDCKYNYYQAAGKIVTAVLTDTTEIDGVTVVTDVTGYGVTLGGNHRLVNNINMSYTTKSMTLLSGGGSSTHTIGTPIQD